MTKPLLFPPAATASETPSAVPTPVAGNSGSDHHVAVAAMVEVLAAITARQQPALDAFPRVLADAIRLACGAHATRDSQDLDRTVAFSMQASSAVAAVARITGEVRETNARAQSMAAAVEQLTTSIDQISTSADQASGEMAAASTQSDEGAKATSEAARASRAAADAFGRMSRANQELGAATAQISAFAGTIESLAKQTNLLALNATIEAARAGDVGRGFAVVAQEVKALSAQTKQATDDIKTRISRLESFVRDLTDNVGEVRTRIEEGLVRAEEASTHIDGVRASIGANADRMASIAQVLQQQTQAVEEISRSVHAVATGAETCSSLAGDALDEVGRSEALIDDQFKLLDGRNIADYTLHRAKSDHCMWKKRLWELFVGLKNFTAGELSDHSQCRLGKWYDRVDDPVIKDQPAFRRLLEPHIVVHKRGKKAAELIASGDRDAARQAMAEMERASAEVIVLLDDLIRR